MKKLIYGFVAAAAVAGLGLVGAGAASAATLYDNDNYTGASFSSTYAPNVGSLNDRASSVSSTGTYTYYEDAGFLGRTVTLSGSYNSLGALSTNLHFGETWSDRISSFE
ncbi:MAG: hypothetical protein WDM88_00245 [Galbitalea sp.]